MIHPHHPNIELFVGQIVRNEFQIVLSLILENHTMTWLWLFGVPEMSTPAIPEAQPLKSWNHFAWIGWTSCYGHAQTARTMAIHGACAQLLMRTCCVYSGLGTCTTLLVAAYAVPGCPKMKTWNEGQCGHFQGSSPMVTNGQKWLIVVHNG